MRSIGPFVAILGLAITVVLVLVLFQTIGLRNDLQGTRAELASVREAVAAQEPGVSEEELVARLDELEARISDSLTATDAGGLDETPAGGSGSQGDIADRLDEILRRIEALDERIDEICDGVPVC